MNLRHIDQEVAETLAMKILAIIGLIALLGFVLWGGVQTVRYAPTAFSNISSALTAAAVNVTSLFIPAQPESDFPIVVTTATTTNTTKSTTVTPSVGKGTTAGQETHVTYPIVQNTQTPVSDPNGKADLAPRIIAVGIIDPTTKTFVEKTTVAKADRVAVRFTVENLGNKVSNQWNFTAVLPTQTIHFFESPSQQPLNPGDRIEYTIAFDSYSGKDNATFTVNVDPSGRLPEASKDNNITRTTIKLTQ